MPAYTLLELTQKVLSHISSDYVNNITDTEESEQVADIIRDTYWNLIETEQSKWEHLKELVQLDGIGDTTKPNYLKLPESVYRIWFVKYNKRKDTDTRDKYGDVHYLTPEEFFDYTNGRNDSETNVIQVSDFSGTELNIYNDRAPTYWTTFDDEHLVFDSYDVDVDTTLQNSKTQCYVSKIPTWTHTDDGVPDLPPQAFSLLLAESKSAAMFALKQQADAKTEQMIPNLRANLKQHSHRVSRGEKRKRYGRSPRK